MNIGTKFPQEGYLQSKTENLNITIEFWIFELAQVPNFSLNRQIWFFGPNLSKKRHFRPKKRKTEHPCQVPHICTGLGKKFSLNRQFYLIQGVSMAHSEMFIRNIRLWYHLLGSYAKINFYGERQKKLEEFKRFSS